MYMVDYSGVNVQVPGKVNYWRTNLDCSKGIKGGVRQSDIHDSSNATLTLCQSAMTKQSLQIEYRETPNDDQCWGTTECMWIRNVAGQKAWLVFCLLPLWSAGRTAVSFCFTSQLIMTDIFFLQSSSHGFAFAFTKCPSTESSCWMQHLVAKYYWQEMSLITIWFHNIQIFVLFIYYIYWNITLCAGM